MVRPYGPPFPEQCKKIGKCDFLGFRRTYMVKPQMSKPYPTNIDHVAQKLFANGVFLI